MPDLYLSRGEEADRYLDATWLIPRQYWSGSQLPLRVGGVCVKGGGKSSNFLLKDGGMRKGSARMCFIIDACALCTTINGGHRSDELEQNPNFRIWEKGDALSKLSPPGCLYPGKRRIH